MAIELKIRTEKNKNVQIDEIDSTDIAVIGISAKATHARDASEFWGNILHGLDCTNEVPRGRRDFIESCLDYIGLSKDELKYQDGSYLSDIDQFDNRFFNISSKEAALMDPNQRLFLELAWKAIEDAGYGGDLLRGSRTGVYVGDVDDVRYKELVTKISPESISVATTGNINAVIASRISYIMDFKGPSMLIDTTCSSSLVAVHLACDGLRNKTCDLAIAGGVRISFLPLIGKEPLGIESTTGKTKSFDNSSDGTVFGEGAVALILKSLGEAIRDEDNIYAVIKGSAINQDGSSIGLTAPNMLSQEDVIVRAWKNSGIDPETIGYIETHGTGTKLGDPVEISGISNAFKRFTDKKQFCAVASVKSNIGHLGNAAGIAGLLKAIFAVKYGVIPPTLHIQNPNNKINFENSPVYINDKVTSWISSGPRRCGISSFGLSGTNCHMVIEEAPVINRITENEISSFSVFVISAKNASSLINMANSNIKYLSKNKDCRLIDICYTTAARRGHYKYRLAVIASDITDLICKLSMVCAKGLENVNSEGIFYGMHNEMPKNKKIKGVNDFSEADRMAFNSLAGNELNAIINFGEDQSRHLDELCKLYIQGADIDWQLLYKDRNCYVVSLPTYDFEKRVNWIQVDRDKVSTRKRKQTFYSPVDHPLVDVCAVQSVDQDIYLTEFSLDRHWVVKDHNILGHYFPPGTSYIEVISAISKFYYGDSKVSMRDVIFLSPLIVKPEENKEVQTIIRKEKEFLRFTIASRNDHGEDDSELWNIHAEGMIYKSENIHSKIIGISDIKDRCNNSNYFQKNENTGPDTDIDSIQVSERWSKTSCEYRIGDGEVLVKLELPEKFSEDLKQYHLHPALFDMAVNAVTQYSGNGLYLPLAYESIDIYGDLPRQIYSHIIKADKNNLSRETMRFDICLTDWDGKVVCDIKGYTVKKVHAGRFGGSTQASLYEKYCHEIGWIENNLEITGNSTKSGSVLIFSDNSSLYQNIASVKKLQGNRVIEVRVGSSFRKIDPEHYIIRNHPDDYIRLFQDGNLEFQEIVHMFSFEDMEKSEQSTEMEIHLAMGIYSLFYIVKALIESRVSDEIDIVILTNYAFEVSGDEKVIYPRNAALAGLGKVIQQEHSHLRCRFVDIDDNTDVAYIISEMKYNSGSYQVVYRNGKRYTEVFRKLNIQAGKQKQIREEGVYLITGGLGGLGLEAAKYLAAKAKINIALVSRGSIPDYNNEDFVLDQETPEVINKITAIRELESMGANISIYSGDISSYTWTEQMLNDLRGRFGRVNGIIHAAGVAGDGFLFRKEKDSFSEVLAPKTLGTKILHVLTCTDNLDFFIMYSSVVTLIGGAGQGAYVAANAYMDSYASMIAKEQTPVLNINWAAWKEIGMAAKSGVTEDGFFRIIDKGTAMQVFDYLLSIGNKRVVVGELNFANPLIKSNNPFISLSQNINKVNIKTESGFLAQSFSKLVQLDNYVDNYSGLEQKIAQLWAQALGEEEVNIYEDFNDMGGDSIIATQLLKLINQNLGKVIDITDIFTYTSVNQMSEYIYQKLNQKENSIIPNDSIQEVDIGDLSSLLEQVESGDISIESGLDFIAKMNGSETNE